MPGPQSQSVLRHLRHLLGGGDRPPDDGWLLERFTLQRDAEAFAELVERHGPLVYGVCQRVLHNTQDAEDVFQATFLVLARKAATIRKPESLSSYLHGIAYRLALRTRTETAKRHQYEQRAAAMRPIAQDDRSWREVRALIDEELERLPEKQRLPLVLCYLEGLTQDEAAQRLGWPRSKLKHRLEAGRERLRRRLTRHGVTLGAGLLVTALTTSASRGAVPIAWRNATVRAGLFFATNAVGGSTSTRAMLLAKYALQPLLTAKLTLGVMVILLFGFVAAVAGLALPQAMPKSAPPDKTRASATPPTTTGEHRPAQAKQVRKDRQGDPLPDGAITRLGTVRFRHRDYIRSVVFTRDNKTAIAGGNRGNIVFWDVATGWEVRRLKEEAPVRMLSALAISPDGKVLVSAGDVRGRSYLCLWDVETGKSRFRVELEATDIRQLLFTPDGKTLIVTDFSNRIRLWSIEQRKVTHELKEHTGIVTSLSLSPDGKTLASGSMKDPHVRLWDIASGKEKLHFRAYENNVLGVAFSPDGKTLAAFGSRDILTFNAGSLAFFDASTGKRLRKITDSPSLDALRYAPDGQTLLGMANGIVHVLDADSGKSLRRIQPTTGHWIRHWAFSPDGKILATFGGGSSRTFDLWDLASGMLLNPLPGHRNIIASLAFSANGRQLFSAAGLGDLPVQVWDARTGERLYEFGNDDPNSAYDLALSPDGKLLAAGGYNDNTVRLWDLASHKQGSVFKGHTNPITAVAWSADGKTLASASWQGKSLYVWDAATGKERWKKEVRFDWPSDLAFSPDSKTLAIGGFNKGLIQLWSAETGKELRTIATPDRVVYSLAFSPDGSTLFSCGETGAIHLCDPATGRLVRQWDTKRSLSFHLALTRDGRTLVTGHFNDGSVRLWEVATGQERACFKGPPLVPVRAVAISLDGHQIASGYEDTTILVWDATVGASSDVALSDEQLRSLWDDLGATDAGRAYRAMWRMALTPERALPFLTQRLRPVAPLDAAQQKQVERLLTDLENDSFTVRDKAEKELANRGATIEPALRKALEGKPDLEKRQRIEAVLEKITTTSGEHLRALRALEALENINTPEARRLLKALSHGVSQAWLTEEAATVYKRAEQSSHTAPE